MAAEEQQGANPPPICPVVLPVPYNGKGSLTCWYERSLSTSRVVNRWKIERRETPVVASSVDRQSGNGFQEDSRRSHGTFADCVEALKERFDPRSKRERYLMELLG